MPVVGHAFVGLATAMCVEPAPRERIRTPFWSPFIVAVAYLPDIVNQIAMLLGTRDHSVITHSVLFALVVSPVIAACAAWLAAVALRRALVVTLVTILLHDVLDLLQCTSRQPWWPLPSGGFRFNVEIIPTDPRSEVLLFGTAFAVFAVGFAILRRLRRAGADADALRAPRGTWAGRTATLAILACACLTHQLRAARENEYRQVQVLLGRREYQAVLDTVDRAERWPSTARPGRLDYVRAEAYLGLGDRDKAERCYRRSYRSDPRYFWVVADLAVFYATSGEPAEQRRRQAAPYMTELNARFPTHRHLDRVIRKIERRLRR